MAVAAVAVWGLVTILWATIGWHWWELTLIAAGALFLFEAPAAGGQPARYRRHRRHTT